MEMDSEFMRSFLTSTKKDPNNALAFSPDIITLDTATPTSDFFVSTYEHFASRPLRNLVKNNIFIRGKGSVQQSVSLYAFPALLIPWPDKWGSSIGKSTIDLALSDGLSASSKPVRFQPKYGADYTLVATNSDLGTLPALNDWRQFVNRVVNSPDVALANVAYVETDVPQFVNSIFLEMRDTAGDTTDISVSLTAVNLPIGSSISLSCSNPNKNHDPIYIENVNISEAAQTVTVNTTVASNFTGYLHVQYHGVLSKHDRSLHNKFQSAANGATLTLSLSTVVKTSGWNTQTLVGSNTIYFDEDLSQSELYHRNVEAEASSYQDFYFRDNIGDTNAVPRSGSAYQSPDIQLMGTSPDIHPTTDLLGDNFKVDVSSNKKVEIAFKKPNYIYIRGQSPVATSGEVFLYYTPSTIIQYPLQWQNNIVRTDDDKQSVKFTAVANTPLVIPAPFNWRNPPAPKENEHFCFFARVSTANNPNDFPFLGNIGDMASYVLTHLGWAWRNVGFTTAGAPLFTATKDIALPPNWPDTTCAIVLMPKNVPDNSTIEFSCGDMGAEPPVYGKGTISGNVGITWQGKLKSGFNSKISFSYTGANLPTTAEFSFTFNKVNNVGSPLYKYGKTAKELNLVQINGKTADTHPHLFGDWQTYSVLGGVSTLMSPNSTLNVEEQEWQQEQQQQQQACV